MTEINPYIEKIQPLSSKIMTPEQFDERVQEDEVFRAQIGGFNSQSLGILQRGLATTPFYFPLYGSIQPRINMVLAEQCYKEVFNKNPLIVNSLSERIVANREYGESNALYELIEQHASVTPQEIEEVLQEFGEYGFIAKHFASPEGVQELQTFMKKGLDISWENILPADPEEDTDVERAARIAHIIGISPDAIADIEKAMQERRGVQVVFGPPDKLATFLRQVHAEAVDDASASITTPIPEELILAILPVGPYEKRELLG